MGDVIKAIVTDIDEPSTGEIVDVPRSPQEPRNGAGPVRKKQPYHPSRLDDLKVSTIRQHYYPEGGWGWVVCVCAFLVHALTHGLLLSYGVFGQLVLKQFGEDYQQEVMWLGCTSVSLGLLCSPLMVGWCRRRSTRLAAVLGGLVAALGCLFASFAQKMHQVFISYGIVMSLGLGLSRVTSFLMVGQYFKRKRGKVEAMVLSGTGCGVALFSYSLHRIIELLGWRLGLHAVTGVTAATFFLGMCYRPASLYHPQRRAILHLKNQHKKIKSKTGKSERPPCVDWQALRSRTLLICILAAALAAPALYASFFFLAPMVSANGLGDDFLLLQLQLGAGFCFGCGLSGALLSRHSTECLVGCKQLCQAGLVALGMANLSAHAFKEYAGFSLFVWLLGVPTGVLHHSLRMLVLERGRFRYWGLMEGAQGGALLITMPAMDWLNSTHGPDSAFYVSAGCCFLGALVLFFLQFHRAQPWTHQGSCSTCASRAPSCGCDLRLQQSQQDSTGSHPKCQKTISFSDTVDVAVDPGSPPIPCRRHQQLDRCESNDLQDVVYGNVDVDKIDADVIICYDDEFISSSAVVQDVKQVSRYGCGHLMERVGVGDDKSAFTNNRSMAVIEEVTSSL